MKVRQNDLETNAGETDAKLRAYVFMPAAGLTKTEHG
jgi:hypothetical protein